VLSPSGQLRFQILLLTNFFGFKKASIFCCVIALIVAPALGHLPFYEAREFEILGFYFPSLRWFYFLIFGFPCTYREGLL
jgi:hypothetical protein